MSQCGSAPEKGQVHLEATTTDVRFAWLTPWKLAIGVRNARSVTKRGAVAGSIQFRPCVQFAKVRADAPGTLVLMDTQMRAGAGENYSADDIGPSASAHTLVRYGVAYGLYNGTFGQADVALVITDDACGRLVGQASLSLQATSTTTAQVAITGWVPAQDAQRVVAALVASGVTGTFQWRLAYRTATTSIEQPNPWVENFDQWRTSVEDCSGELLPVVTGVMWVQIGVVYNLSSGSSLGTGQLTVSVCGRKL